MKYLLLAAIIVCTACGQVPGPKGDTGAPGPQGPQGAVGATGPTGGMCVVTIPPGHHTITINGSCEFEDTK